MEGKAIEQSLQRWQHKSTNKCIHQSPWLGQNLNLMDTLTCSFSFERVLLRYLGNCYCVIGEFKLNTCDAKQFIFLTAQQNKYQSYFFSFQGPQGPLVLPRLVCPSVHPSDRSCSVIHIVPLTSVTPVTPVTPVTSVTTLTNVAPVTLLHLITSFYTPVTPYHSNVTPL